MMLGQHRVVVREVVEIVGLAHVDERAQYEAHAIERLQPQVSQLCINANRHTADYEATGLPVLYNTSFNLFGDPLVSTPRDAVRSFYSSGIDALFVGNFLVEK